MKEKYRPYYHKRQMVVPDCPDKINEADRKNIRDTIASLYQETFADCTVSSEENVLTEEKVQEMVKLLSNTLEEKHNNIKKLFKFFGADFDNGDVLGLDKFEFQCVPEYEYEGIQRIYLAPLMKSIRCRGFILKGYAFNKYNTKINPFY